MAGIITVRGVFVEKFYIVPDYHRSFSWGRKQAFSRGSAFLQGILYISGGKVLH
ncbi:hypothetical protein [Desulfurobacterium sp.]|uniref:hypothetical protein n=1 Tax=Desulfurobacterium sp. TaxID=2004706 RepID=UPI00260BFE93|nr:hypothetical protein [Desulfurobacterium sp.]